MPWVLLNLEDTCLFKQSENKSAKNLEWIDGWLNEDRWCAHKCMYMHFKWDLWPHLCLQGQGQVYIPQFKNSHCWPKVLYSLSKQQLHCSSRWFAIVSFSLCAALCLIYLSTLSLHLFTRAAVTVPNFLRNHLTSNGTGGERARTISYSKHFRLWYLKSRRMISWFT